MDRHVGDGNVHSLALFNNDEELAVVRKAVHEMVDRAIRLDGTCSGEHGVGLGKVEYLESELGVGTVGLMETIKRTCQSLFLGSCLFMQGLVLGLILISGPFESDESGKGQYPFSPGLYIYAKER